MWFELKVWFTLALIWVFEKLRIITKEDADQYWDLLIYLSMVEAFRRREQEIRSWNL